MRKILITSHHIYAPQLKFMIDLNHMACQQASRQVYNLVLLLKCPVILAAFISASDRNNKEAATRSDELIGYRGAPANSQHAASFCHVHLENSRVAGPSNQTGLSWYTGMCRWSISVQLMLKQDSPFHHLILLGQWSDRWPRKISCLSHWAWPLYSEIMTKFITIQMRQNSHVLFKMIYKVA